jgi:hypothetical protein
VDAAAVRQSRQRGRARAHHRAGNPGRLCRQPDRRADHRRGHGRPPHRLRRGTQEALAGFQGLCRGTDAFAGHFRGQPAPHPIQGIGAGFIPGNLHTQAIDGAIQVDPADAKEWARRSAREEGLLVGISSGATLAAIAAKLRELPAGSRVLGFNYDTGERYLSVPDFLPE